MYDFEQRENEKQREKEEVEMNRKNDLNDVRIVLSTAAGRRFLKRIMRECAVRENIFHSDAMVMAATAGRQSVGNDLLKDVIAVAPLAVPVVLGLIEESTKE
ncbi:MAG: hypothetical protein PHV34_17575 [Verrucomicrobiae bacterium]|nr:hypothetical protein [Verrucomicrobiae bacterium]